MNSAAYLETIWQDSIYALRAMRKNPLFAMTAVLTLALGIGGNTALFTVIRAVLLKPLEYRDPDRLVRVSVNLPNQPNGDLGLSLDRFQEIRKSVRSFSEFGAFGRPENMALSGGGVVLLFMFPIAGQAISRFPAGWSEEAMKSRICLRLGRPVERLRDMALS